MKKRNQYWEEKGGGKTQDWGRQNKGKGLEAFAGAGARH